MYIYLKNIFNILKIIFYIFLQFLFYFIRSRQLKVL